MRLRRKPRPTGKNIALGELNAPRHSEDGSEARCVSFTEATRPRPPSPREQPLRAAAGTFSMPCTLAGHPDRSRLFLTVTSYLCMISERGGRKACTYIGWKRHRRRDRSSVSCSRSRKQKRSRMRKRISRAKRQAQNGQTWRCWKRSAAVRAAGMLSPPVKQGCLSAGDARLPTAT